MNEYGILCFILGYVFAITMAVTIFIPWKLSNIRNVLLEIRSLLEKLTEEKK